MLGYAILMARAFLCCGWNCNSGSPSWGDFPTTLVTACCDCLITWECGTPVLRKRQACTTCMFLPHKQLPVWNKKYLSCRFAAYFSGFFLQPLLGHRSSSLSTHTLYLFFNKHISPRRSIRANSHQYLPGNIAVIAGLCRLLTSKHSQLPDKSLSGAID